MIQTMRSSGAKSYPDRQEPAHRPETPAKSGVDIRIANKVVYLSGRLSTKAEAAEALAYITAMQAFLPEELEDTAQPEESEPTV